MADSFDKLLQKALASFATPGEMEEQLPHPASPRELQTLGDDRYLSTLCRRVFRAGLKHSMVDARWPQFEEVFHDFQPAVLAAMGDEALEAAMEREGIISHWGKIKSIRANAQMIQTISAEHGSFGAWLAGWPASDIVGLWRELKSRGSQLGGKSGPSFLRMVGKDTFLLTDDVVQVLVAQGVVDKKPTSQKALAQVQAAFNQWHEESGRPLCQLSRIISYCA